MICTNKDVVEQTATIAPLEQHREIEVQDANHIISLAPHKECNDLIDMVESIVEEAKNDIWPTIITSEIYKSILQSEILCKQHLYWQTIEATLAESLKRNKATENSSYKQVTICMLAPKLGYTVRTEWVEWEHAFWNAHQHLCSDMPVSASKSASKGMQVRVFV